MAGDENENDPTCWGSAEEAGAPGYCGKPMVCLICDTCPAHCLTDGDPDRCWQAHESWRLGGPDTTFGPGAMTTSPKPGIVPAAPKPRWPKPPS